MPKKLNTYVHVVERDDTGNQTNAGTFGPNDTVPDWAVRAITNPDVWAQDGDDEDPGPDPAANTELPAASATDRSDGRPPTSGAGSGRDAWAAYATSKDVEVTDDMDRAAIIAAVDAKK